MRLSPQRSTRSSPRIGRLQRYIPTNKPLLRLLLNRVRTRRSDGDIDSARWWARLAVRLHPTSLDTRRVFGQVLSSSPTTAGLLDEALEIIREDLRRAPRDARSTRQLVDNLSQRLKDPTLHGTHRAVLELLAGLPEDVVVEQMRNGVDLEMSQGSARLSLDMSTALFAAVPTSQSGLLAHDAAVRSGRIDTAKEISDEIEARGLATPEDSVFMASEQHLAVGRAADAIATMVDLRPQRETRYSQQFLRALKSLGCHREIIDYVRQTAHGLSPVAEGLALHDAHVALGEDEIAHQIVYSLSETHFDDLSVFRSLRASVLRRNLPVEMRKLEDRMDQLVQDRLGADVVSVDTVAALISLRFEMEQFDEIERLATSVGADLIGPTSRRILARSAYLQRDFPQALRHISMLETDGLPWDIRKLKARVLFEKGEVQTALRLRQQDLAPHHGFDEVEYHALLALGRYDEAFGKFVDPDDLRRFADTFGDRFDRVVSSNEDVERVIVAQGGPGDEVLLASTYELASRRSGHLSATCEPRLADLLSRSFPCIEFIPVDRNSRHGRSGVEHSLWDLLDERSFAAGMRSGSVVLARHLGLLKHEEFGVDPIPPYLVPEPDKVDYFRIGWQGRPTVGVVWRSERREAQRNIHYLTVQDLAPFFERDARFLCLQYDATADEIDEFRALAGSKASFIPRVDIRDDLDTTAALLRSLTATVGIGTTTSELSAAVGTATIMIQPTRFGTWRAVGPSGADYWHQTLRVTDVDTPWDRQLIVEQACTRLDDVLSAAAAT